MRISWSRWQKLFCIGGILCGTSVAWANAPGPLASELELIKRGEYLAKAADCGACHTVIENKPFAGGLPISSPVGVIYSTNITSSVQFGIGGYTLTQFSQALRGGIRNDGANLYPAMPYTSYSLLTDADVRALYAYFMKSVAPINMQGPQTDLAFPLNIRLSMKAWNFLFLNKTPYSAAPDHDAEWNRGRYLVQALAHCGECHTPRGPLMQTRSGRELAGAQVGPWYAPNVTSDLRSGVGSWTTEELARYLKTGVLVGKARAAGSMAEAVEHSFQYLSDADLHAMASYVTTVPAIHDDRDLSSRFALGAGSSELATLRGSDGISADSGNLTGAQLFQAHCASCHEALGQGTKDGYYPSMFDNSAVGALNPNNMIATIINGVNRTTSGGQVYMPGFGGHPHDLAALTDGEIALVSHYLIDHFGRGSGEVTSKQVAEVRRGGPGSMLPALARLAVVLGATGGIVVAILLVRLCMRRSRMRGMR